MSNYRIETLSYEELTKVMSIPHYQRPLVWSQSQKLAFIDNISKGFPFGSLLLYKYESGEKYSLIDGQQRLTTLQDYQKHPEIYFPIESEDSEYIDKLLEITGAINQSTEGVEDLRHKYTDIVKDILHKHATGENPLPTLLSQEIRKVFPSAFSGEGALDISDKVVNIQNELISALNRYVDLSSLMIPCVIFTGDKSQLPEVFANVNLGGRKLTKYQVFAAQWDRYKVKLSQQHYSSLIMDKAVARYEKLTEQRNGLEIEDFSPEEMKASGEVTLPELCRALGECIVEETPSFWPEKTKQKDDIVDTIGYNTLSIVFGIKPQEIAGRPSGAKGLPDRFSEAGFESDPTAIEELVDKILKEYTVIHGQFAKHLKLPGTKRGYETSKSSVVLQFLSFFAALWRIHYGVVSTAHFAPIEGYLRKNGYDDSRQQIFKCFLLDMLNDKWKGSGDSRLGGYIDGTLNYYSVSSFSREALVTALQVYLEAIKDSESINADPMAKTIITVLANYRHNQYEGSSYDIEHLISREALRTKVDGIYAYKACKIPGGSLGNLAFLTEHENRSKGSTSIADTCGELTRFCGEREFIEDRRSLSEADHDLRHGLPEQAKKFIHLRAQTMADQLVADLCP